MKIINRYTLTYEGLFCKGTKQLIHLHQGDMDGACAVYSLMMGLLSVKALRRNDVMPFTEHNGRTAKGRLVKEFLEKHGLVRNGYVLETLVNSFNSAARKLADCTYHYIYDDCYSRERGFFDCIKEALDEDLPVEIGYSYGKDRGHAVLVIGYEESKTKVNFFCLDPGHPLEKGQYWNNVVTLDKTEKSKMNAESLRDSYNTRCKVNVEEAIVIAPR